MGHVIKALVALAAVAAAAWLIATRVLGTGDGEPREQAPPTVAGPPAPAPQDPSDVLARADDLQFPDLWRRARERAADDAGRKLLDDLVASRGETAAANLERDAEELLGRYRYRSAIALAERYAAAWAGTPSEAPMRELVRALRDEQTEQVAARRREAEELAAAGRTQAAREALRTGLELEAEVAAEFEDFAIALERRMGPATHPAPRDPSPTGPRPPSPLDLSLKAEPSPPPALPGYPHPDVKRLDEARRALKAARDLFAGSKYQAAAKSLEDLVGFYGDLRFVQVRKPAVAALNALARHASSGASGLFNAASVKRDGRNVTLRYTFADDAQFLDWEQMQTLPFGGEGKFEGAREGVRGTGSTGYLLRAFFENQVEIRCDATPQQTKTFGLLLCQHELETRQLMWIVTNHYFVEGENYRLERPGHAILMWGKGVNNDVPLDSPEIGFIFRGPSIDKPSPMPGETVQISFELKGNTMEGAIVRKGDRGKRAGEAVGDDGRGIEKTRPGLLVVENGVLFRDVVVQGRLHPEFERERVRQLLDLAALLD